MTTVILENKTWTPEEYFEIEKYSEEKHEFYFGNLITMPGESRIANKINRNFVRALEKGVNPDLFEIYNHDVRLVVRKNEIYRYPDIVVTSVADSEDSHAVEMPILVVEVLSESTQKVDLTDKLQEYSSISSLQYYFIVSQDHAIIQLYHRNENRRWEFDYYTNLSENIELKEFETTISLQCIYDRIVFEEIKK